MLARVLGLPRANGSTGILVRLFCFAPLPPQRKRPAPLRIAGFAARVLGLVLLVSACTRSTPTWLAELRHSDPWRRRMAAHALGRAPDQDLEAAFRALTTRLLEDDPSVRAAMVAALRELAQRRPELPGRALGVLAPERQLFRTVMAELLLELEQSGDTAAAASLTTYLEGELASGVPMRVQAAKTLRKRRVEGTDQPVSEE